MDEYDVLIALRDTLRENLEDPYFQYTGKTRNWIHDDNPLSGATFPRIQIVQREPVSTEIVSMGFDFQEWYTVVYDIYFITKIGFKWKNDDDSVIQDETLCKKYNTKIWDEIKAKGKTLRDDYGIVGLKCLGKNTLDVDADTQFRRGVVSVRTWFFKK